METPDWEELSDVAGELADHYRGMQTHIAKLERLLGEQITECACLEVDKETLNAQIKRLEITVKFKTDVCYEADKQIDEMEEAMLIWVRDYAGPKIHFGNRNEAIRYFLDMAALLDKVSEDPDKPRSRIKGWRD